MTPQEIRLSLYHSEFYNALMMLNSEEDWRKVLANPIPDLHLKDVEILLRVFAMMIDHDHYTPSMVKFLNQFSRKCQTHSEQQNKYLVDLFRSFLEACSELPKNAFLGRKTGRFSIALIEAVFTAVSRDAFKERRMIEGKIDHEEIDRLANDAQFLDAATKASTRSSNVQSRLNRGAYYITAL